MSWLKAIFSFLGELFKVVSQKQLLDAGEAKAERKQNALDNEAAAKADKIIQDNAVLDINTMRDKLRKLRKTK